MSSAKQQVRERFRDAVFARDGHCCVFCPRTDNLDAHHIVNRKEMPNGGYVVTNGISLCPTHHVMAEDTYFGRATHPGFSPSELYAKIGSSKQQAISDSERLARW